VTPARNVVRGQSVEEDKADRAREFRRAMTPTERALWDRLRADRLGGFHFRRQQVIDGFIADFYCHAAALVVEADGSAHDGREAADADRDRVFAGRGLFVLRVRNEDVAADIEGVLARIEGACRRRAGWRQPHPPGPPLPGGEGGDELRDSAGRSVTLAVSQEPARSGHPLPPRGRGLGGGVEGVGVRSPSDSDLPPPRREAR
jgi:very-short-patch-repair endonuclease